MLRLWPIIVRWGMLQPPTEGYEDCNRVRIHADNFVLKHSLLLLLFHKEIDEAFYEHGDRFIDLLSGNAASWNDRECLKIIESKSKVRQSQSKAIVAKVSTSSSTPGVSPDVAELKDMVKALLLDKKNQSQAPATVKAVEESCVTCGGAHSHRNCPATDGNVYRDNIQEYMSQAAAGFKILSGF
ncbi:hypothetical protein Tco_0476359 [Tanacetum coccineum]